MNEDFLKGNYNCGKHKHTLELKGKGLHRNQEIIKKKEYVLNFSPFFFVASTKS